jgi:ABC-2 type transport system permease protein
MLFTHARAILWAQMRSLVNFYTRGNFGMLIFTLVMSAFWYGLLVFGGVAASMVTSDPRQLPMLQRSGSAALFFMFLYWQVVPILMASTGAGIDLKRITVYPVSRRELFTLEVLLRLTTGADMLLILIGAFVGLAMNPAVPWAKPLVFLPWVAFNLLLATGLRDLLGRMLARRRGRELAMLALVLLGGMPQVLFISGAPEWLRAFRNQLDFNWWPWLSTARLATDRFRATDLIAILAWTAGAAVFGWRQFQRGFAVDTDEARATPTEASRFAAWTDRLYSLPSVLLPDPLGGLVEKEIRFLSRAPRFRIVFLMGFSFGLLIWLPLAFRGGQEADGFFAQNYLTIVSGYALMLLGEVSFWNVFGFDRGAVLNYFVLPVKFSRVLIAKNITAAVFVFLEIGAIALVCFLLRMPVTLAKLAECYAVTAVMTLLLLAVGNLGSVYYPRPVNPGHSWRSAAAGRFQAFLMLLYPLVSIPVILAYLARYAFETQWAFVGVLAVGAAIGAIVYSVALDSAVEAVEKRREQVLTALSAGEGPVTA